jgi:antitoxin VapB
MTLERNVKIFRNGRNKAVRIPKDFEFPGNDATIRKEGDRLIIEPKRKGRRKSLKALFASWEPIKEEFPEIPDPPPDPVEI